MERHPCEMILDVERAESDLSPSGSQGAASLKILPLEERHGERGEGGGVDR